MSYTVNFDRSREKWVRLVSPLGDRVWRWDLPVDATTNSSSVDPESDYPLVYGEFLEIDNDGNAVRGADPTGSEAAETVDLADTSVVNKNASYMMFAEKGRTDLQMRGGVPLLMLGAYVMETKLFHSTSAFAVDDELYVGNVDIGLTYYPRGLCPLSLTGNPGTAPVIGRVIKTPANNGGWLRFVWTLT